MEGDYAESIKKVIAILIKQACKPRSYVSSKLQLTYLLTGVKCRAASIARKTTKKKSTNIYLLEKDK